MNKKNIYIKSLITIIICLSFSKFGYSQPEYKNSYELSLSNLALGDLTFIYTRKINDLKYLEISNSFVIHKRKEHINPIMLLYNTQDPFLLYDLYRLRIGLRFFNKDNSYVCPMLIFNAGYFQNIRIWHYINITGDAKDKDYLLSRTKFEAGALIKYGDIKTFNNGFIQNTYVGFGFKVKFMDDTIYQIWEWHKPVPNANYPIHEKHMKVVPTFHFGITFGYTK